ncbi:hypothetical protein B0H14DRAFT_2630509 [Mycena olivaceomarginata]|nr:hypothetical protein B0H14DRAFT_2630509 [Mycena olivaceomarginata]
MPVEVFNHILDLTCGTYLNPHGLYTESCTRSAHFVHQHACLGAVSRNWMKAVNNKRFLWNTWCGSTHGSIETFNECTSHFGPGPVDLGLEFKPGPARPGKVSTPALLELVHTVTEQCTTLSLFMIDDIDTADIISTVHSNRFPRLSNLSITVLYWGEPSYDGTAPETTFPAAFAHFPNTLRDLRLDGHPIPWTTPESFGLRLGRLDSPSVGEFEALLKAAPNLERLSMNCVATPASFVLDSIVNLLRAHVNTLARILQQNRFLQNAKDTSSATPEMFHIEFLHSFTYLYHYL